MIHEVFIVLRGKDVLVHVDFEEANPAYNRKLSESVISFFNTTSFKFKRMLVEDKCVVFEQSDKLAVILIGDETDELSILEKHAKWILGAFINKFGTSFEKWSGDITEFEKFKRIIERVVTAPKLILKMVLVGSPGVGKTTLMKLLIGEEPPKEYVPTTKPERTILGEFLELKGFYEIAAWDLPGQISYRKFWDTYLKDSDIVILVTDSTPDDVDDLRRLLKEIKENINREDLPTKIIVIANKQDLPGAMKPEEISKAIGMEAHGFVAIDKSYRPKLINLILSAAEEIAGKIFERTEKRIEEAQKLEEILETLREFKRDLIKYLPINHPAFLKIDYWIRHLKTQGKISEKEAEKLHEEMKSLRKLVSDRIKIMST